MRRALVLTDESARHPFRAMVPQRMAFWPQRIPSEQMTVQEPGQASDKPSWMLTASDVRGFATTYTACFIATLAFIL